MKKCIEFAVFKVSPVNKQRVIELSHLIFSEMNQNSKVILSYDILEKTDDINEICWQITWLDKNSAKETTAKWPSFPSTNEFQSLVGENVYYAHFESVMK